MKVTLWGPLPPPSHGVSLSLREFSAHLSKNNEVSLIKTSPTRGGFTFNKISISNLILFVKLIFLAVFQAVCNRKSIVYMACATKGPALLRDALVCLVYRLLRKNMYIHIQGTELKSKKWFLRKAISYCFSWHSKIYVSEALRDSHEFLNAKGKVLVVPNGCHDYLEINIERKKVTQPMRLLFLSNFLKSKGIEEFLEVCSILRKKNCKLSIYLCGSYSEDYKKAVLLEKIQSLGLNQFVKFIGPVNEVQKKQTLANVDYLIFPSYKESFGNVIIEAMSSGVFVITSNTTSAKFILDNGRSGVVLEEFIPAECAEVLMKTTVQPTKYSETIRNARARYLDNFALTAYCENLTQAISND
jgi:glycosyltransferase involved in cell wall biosynthesis